MDAAEGLQEEMQACREEFDRVVDAIGRRVDDADRQLGAAKGDFERESKELLEKEAFMTAKAQRVAADHAEEDRKTAEVAADLEKLRFERDAMPKELGGLREGISKAADEKAAVDTDLAAKQREAADAVGELTKGVAFYKRLGLEFDGYGEDVLRLRFTQIDPANPSREFMFGVNVTEANEYRIAVVEPALPAATVASLLEALNETNDFSFFVRRMRQEFKTLACTPVD